MSKKLEIKSCKECPHLQFSQNHNDYICEAFGEEIRRVDLYDIDAGKIVDICPLEEYDQPVVRWSEKPVLNRHTITNAFGLKERSPLREEYENHVSVPEMVAPAVVEMESFVILISYRPYSEIHYAPNGNAYHNHPNTINEFLTKVKEAGGNILSMQAIESNDNYSVHYELPVGTFPINV